MMKAQRRPTPARVGRKRATDELQRGEGPGTNERIGHDKVTSIQDLQDQVAEFARERDWQRFHSPKNLSMALAVEAAELLELFQWKSEQESWGALTDARMREHVTEEMADIGIFLLNLCNQLDIDLASSIAGKIRLNARRYPAHLVRGKAVKHGELAGGSGRPPSGNVVTVDQDGD